MDMIGRGSAADIAGGGPAYLELVGARRLSTELGDVAERVNAAQPTPFRFNYAFDAPGDREQYYCRADHFSYARYGIPSINFSRGDHPDYHEVTDEPQYIDYSALARVATYVRELAVVLGDLDHRVRVDGQKQKDPHDPCVQ
jgi:Zn-dependent M28 family amino/carboxypeptidase